MNSLKFFEMIQIQTVNLRISALLEAFHSQQSNKAITLIVTMYDTYTYNLVQFNQYLGGLFL